MAVLITAGITTYAQPSICIETGTGLQCNPTSTLFEHPCININYHADQTIPSGYVAITKLQWYFNNTLMKTVDNPSSANDFKFTQMMQARDNIVYFTITYRKGNNDLVPSKSGKIFIESGRRN